MTPTPSARCLKNGAKTSACKRHCKTNKQIIRNCVLSCAFAFSRLWRCGWCKRKDISTLKSSSNKWLPLISMQRRKRNINGKVCAIIGNNRLHLFCHTLKWVGLQDDFSVHVRISAHLSALWKHFTSLSKFVYVSYSLLCMVLKPELSHTFVSTKMENQPHSFVKIFQTQNGASKEPKEQCKVSHYPSANLCMHYSSV